MLVCSMFFTVICQMSFTTPWFTLRTLMKMNGLRLLSRKMIKDVDLSTVLDSGVIDSPVFGKIPPERLSGGVKTLILIDNEPEKVFYASACGDNCAKWLLKIAEEKDITVNLRHLMNFGDAQFSIRILNTNQIVHSMKELVPIAGLYV